jgi:coenzyme F420 hydrogenase subunit beta
VVKGFEDLKREVIDAGLCTRCGSCVGVCPENAVQFADPLGECLPVLVKDCCSSGLCYAGCSGKTVNFPQINEQVFGTQPHSYLLGYYRNLSVGFARDPLVRQGAASGGIASAISIYLLEKGLVDGVVTLVDSDQQPYRAVPKVVTTRQEVLDAAQSRYSISPVNTIFRELENRDGLYAYVGLPCQVHSLRKLQAAGYAPAQRIKYVIGIYCGNILHFDSVRSFLHRNGVRDLSQVASLKYRAGEWPGKMEARLKDGRVFALEKFYANYLIPFYIMKRCLLCTDLTNEFSDVSIGDGWAPAYDERGKGWSIVLGRSQIGVELLEEMQTDGRLELHPVEYEAAINMHSHGLDLKKRGAFLRIRRRARRGIAVPSYGYQLEGVGVARHMQEAVIDTIFTLAGMKPSRWLVNRLPVVWIGRFFKLLRKVWIRTTRSTKRSGLSQTRFIRTAISEPNGDDPEKYV